ncbi:MAG: L-serine ammonia-lyase, iron-sulfur-dependent, subunit alpha, partial [Bacteroidales bacterium]|nr:L-serine ammonia-lyase, iron-sulfur-dependent, subunit alpha [Bacteroidales bacterium]
MESIKSIYKIGYGPSSSHTMGPRKAAEIFKDREKNASAYRVTLYGSLAATGKGHFTDKAIIAALAPTPVEIVWRADIVPEFHTNGMLFEALDSDSKVTSCWMVYSIGGGSLSEGEESIPPKQVYSFNYLSDIQKYIEENGLSFWEYVEQNEDSDIWDYLAEAWEQMQQTVRDGLANDSVLPGSLHLRSKAKQYFIRASGLKPSLQSRALVIAYALAVSEQNARGGKVVTAPTCGSCGVVPGVLYHMKEAHGFSDRDILKALATAGVFGNIIKTNASISGAEVGCQGEIGSACVMAAVSINQLFGGSPQQIECAAELAMEHNLGLTCDPVCGMVQIPCIDRNAIAALRAQDVSLYALMSDGKHLVSFDSIVETMKKTGHDLPSPYKETALGGLATT